jgi:hypothetical protein
MAPYANARQNTRSISEKRIGSDDNRPLACKSLLSKKATVRVKAMCMIRNIHVFTQQAAVPDNDSIDARYASIVSNADIVTDNESWFVSQTRMLIVRGEPRLLPD